MTKQTSVDEIMKQVKQYESKKHFVLAAELAEQHGLLEEAIRLYTREGKGLYYNAAVLERKLGRTEPSNQLFDRAIEFFERVGIYYTATGIAREKGDLKKETELREKYHIDPDF